MTLVAARCFGKRIVVMSDTMISNRNKPTANTFPGRLKSIIINTWLTISYAGLSSQALDVIRSIAHWPLLTTNAVIDELLKANIRFANEMEFIVCSHEHDARLVRISNGIAAEGSNFYWIGHGTAAAELSKLDSYTLPFPGLPDFMSAEEVGFVNTFINYLSSGDAVRYGVGGAAINCLCSEYGHCYQVTANAFAWDFTLEVQDPLAIEILKKSGMGNFTYNVYAPGIRGQAVVGLFFSQSETAYIYTPLKPGQDDAIKVSRMTHTSVTSLLGKTAAETAGIPYEPPQSEHTHYGVPIKPVSYRIPYSYEYHMNFINQAGNPHKT